MSQTETDVLTHAQGLVESYNALQTGFVAHGAAMRELADCYAVEKLTPAHDQALAMWSTNSFKADSGKISIN